MTSKTVKLKAILLRLREAKEENELLRAVGRASTAYIEELHGRLGWEPDALNSSVTPNATARTWIDATNAFKKFTEKRRAV